AIDETDRRRARQAEYNAQHGIVPRGVVRPIADIMEGAREAVYEGNKGDRRRNARRVADSAAESMGAVAPEQLGAALKKLEQQMFKHARDLEFEEAARIRDEIQKLKARTLVG